MKGAPALASFNSGELSPYMEGRVDQARYQNGAHQMLGFMPLVQGPAVRRGGSYWVNPIKDSTKRCWLRPFKFSITQSYQLEFGDKYLRFYTQHGQLQTGTVPAWVSGLLSIYFPGALVSRLGVNYYCTAFNANQQPPNANYWYPLTGTIYEIPTPWAVADLTDGQGAFALKITQSGDVLYIAGGAATATTPTGYQPYTLTSFNTTSWVLAPYSPNDGPFQTLNTDLTTALWVSGISGSVTINSNNNVFAATDVGRLVRIAQQNFNVPTWANNVAYTVGKLVRFAGNTYQCVTAGTSGSGATAGGTYAPPTQTNGTAFDGSPGCQWLYMDSGYGIARVTAFTSATQVTATVLTQFPQACVGNSAPITAITQANPAVVSAVNTFNTGDTVMIYGVVGMTQINNKLYTIGTAGAGSFPLTGIDSTAYTAYTSGGFAVDGASAQWQLGAWSSTTEWPRACSFFRNRLFWFGALGIWGSVPGLFTSQAVDTFGVTTANNAISIYLNTNGVTTINWALPLDRLIIGCDQGEFALYEQTTNLPLGPANVQYVAQSSRGTRTIQAIQINTSAFYMQRAGRKLMSAEYDFTIDKYRSFDRSAWAYHMTKGTVVDMTYQAEPWSILWFARADGQLIGFTYDFEQDVWGWHGHAMGPTLGGGAVVESVSSIPNPAGSGDELWMIVKRVIGGVTVRSVEYLTKIYEDGDTQSSCFYVDAGATYSGASTQTITGLAYLNGETVSILTNGAVHPSQTVVGGQISLQWPATIVNIGLAFPAVLVTERPEAGGEDGTSQGMTKRTSQIDIRFYNTLGGFFGMDGGVYDEIAFRDATMNMDQAPPLFTGDKQLTFPGDYSLDNRIHIEQDQPLPMTVIGLFPRMVAYSPT